MLTLTHNNLNARNETVIISMAVMTLWFIVYLPVCQERFQVLAKVRPFPHMTFELFKTIANLCVCVYVWSVGVEGTYAHSYMYMY